VLGNKTCRGPFACCLFSIALFYKGVCRSINDHNDAEPSTGSQWINMLTVHNVLRASGNYEDLFALLDDLIDKAERLGNTLRRATHATQQTRSTKLAGMIKDRATMLKKLLLAHPINIVMAAFLINDQQCLFDYDKVSQGIDEVTGMPKFEKRDAKSFLQRFPYEYLAIVYKISYEIFVVKNTKSPHSHGSTGVMNLWSFSAKGPKKTLKKQDTHVLCS